MLQRSVTKLFQSLHAISTPRTMTGRLQQGRNEDDKQTGADMEGKQKNAVRSPPLVQFVSACELTAHH